MEIIELSLFFLLKFDNYYSRFLFKSDMRNADVERRKLKKKMLSFQDKKNDDIFSVFAYVKVLWVSNLQLRDDVNVVNILKLSEDKSAYQKTGCVRLINIAELWPKSRLNLLIQTYVLTSNIKYDI